MLSADPVSDLKKEKLILSQTKPQHGAERWAQSPTPGEETLLVSAAGQERRFALGVWPLLGLTPPSELTHCRADGQH